MQRSAALAGIIGLVLLAFGVLDYFIASGFHLFVMINVVAGVFALVLWATNVSRESLGNAIGSRTTKYGANASIYSIIFIALLIGVNYLASQYNRRFDTTQEKVYSLSPQSVQVVQALKRPIKFYGFFQGGTNPQAQQEYEAYQYVSPQVSYQMIDPDRHPELAERYHVTLMNTTRVQYGDDNPAHGTNVTELSEENLTNAILKLTRGGTKVAYFLDGEGEADPDDSKSQEGMSNFKQAMEGEGYQIKKVFLATRAEVPKDCSILIVAGPTRVMSQHVLDAFDSYLKHGGNALVMLRPVGPDLTDPEAGLVALLGREWEMKVGNDIVVDQVLRLFAGPALGLNPMVDDYPDSPITHNFTQRVVFPETRSVTPLPGKAGLTVLPVARTSGTSWAETDLSDLYKKQTAKLDAQDTKGPITVAASVQAFLEALGYAKSGEARMVVLGSTDLANNQYFDQFYNRDFVMNSTDWLAGESKSISIRPRSLRASSFRLTVAQFSIVFALSVLLLPELLLIAGIAVWWERRN